MADQNTPPTLRNVPFDAGDLERDIKSTVEASADPTTEWGMKGDYEGSIPADTTGTIVQGAATDVGVQMSKDDPYFLPPADYSETIWDVGKEMATELFPVMGVAVATQTLTKTPAGLAAYIAINAGNAVTWNYVAQNMRIERGVREEYSFGEGAASGIIAPLVMLGGIKQLANASTKARVIRRGLEGAVIGGTESTMRQGFQLALDEREEFSGYELGLSLLFGGGIGAGIGRIESAKIWNRYNINAEDARAVREDVLHRSKEHINDLTKLIEKEADPTILAALQKELDEFKDGLSVLERQDREFLEGLAKQANELDDKTAKEIRTWIESVEGKAAQQPVDYVSDPGKVAKFEASENPVTHEPFKPASATYKREHAAWVEKNKRVGSEPPPPSPPKKPPLTAKEREAIITKYMNWTDDELTALTSSGTDVIPINLAAFTQDGDVQRMMGAVLDTVGDAIKSGRVKMTRERLIQLASDRRAAIDGPGFDPKAYSAAVANELDDHIIKAFVADSLLIQQHQSFQNKMASIDLAEKTTNPALYQAKMNDLAADLMRIREMSESSASISTSSGRLLQQRRNPREIIQGEVVETIAAAKKELGAAEADLLRYSKDMSPGELKTQLEKLGGIKKLEAYIANLGAINNTGKMLEHLQLRGKGMGAKIRDIVEEVGFSAILSNPSTLGAATFGNTWQGIMLPINQIIGGLATGKLPIAMHGFRTFTSMFHGANDAFKAAIKAFSLTRGDMAIRHHYERIGKYAASSRESTNWWNSSGEAVENIGNLITFGPKGLVFLDEFYRHLFAKAQVRSLLIEDHNVLVRAGRSTPADFEDYVEGQMTRYFVEGRRFKTEDDVALDAVREARRQNLSPTEAVPFMRQYREENWNNKISSEIAYLRDFGDQLTYQRHLSKTNPDGTPTSAFERLATAAQEIRSGDDFAGFITRFYIPFLRTPANITMDFAGTMPGIGMGKRLRHDIFRSDNPYVKAQAIGKQMTGMGLWGGSCWLAYNKIITPAGPRDWQERVRKEETGWLPNALNWTALKRLASTGKNDGDQEGDVYYSLERLDPLASILQISATVIRMHEDNDVPEELWEELTGKIAYAFQEIVANRTYMKTVGDGISSLIEGRYETESLAENIGESVVQRFTPSILNSIGRSQDPILREVNGPIEALRNRIAGLSRQLDPKRDVFGRTRLKAPTRLSLEINPFVPTRYSKSTTNRALNVIAEVRGRYAFPKSNEVIPGIDLREVRNPETNQSAYDRWKEIYSTLEVKGKTAPEMVLEVYDHPTSALVSTIPKGLPITDIRKKAINNVLVKYREIALQQMIKTEYPQFLDQYKVKHTLQKMHLKGEELPDEIPVGSEALQQLLDQ